MAQKFSGLTSSCTLWTGANTNPPPGAMMSSTFFTTSLTSSGVPLFRVVGYRSLHPENQVLAKSSLSLQFHPGSRVLHRVQNIKPASIRSGRMVRIAPQLCMNIFTSGKRFFRCPNKVRNRGITICRKVSGSMIVELCEPRSSHSE